MEKWKDVVGYEWLYQVSNIGNVKSFLFKEPRNMKILKNWYWYKYVWFYKNRQKAKNFTIHRLVALNFLEKPEWKYEVNHIDGDKNNNRVDNLEWCTRSNNQKHAYRNWLQRTTNNNCFIKNNPNKWKFWKNNRQSKPVIQYDLQWNFIKEWDSVSDVTRDLWIDNGNICSCCNWKRKSNWWYIWKYKTQSSNVFLQESLAIGINWNILCLFNR